MYRIRFERTLLMMLAMSTFVPARAQQPTPAADQTAIQALKEQISALKTEYEKRIKDLESRVEALQLQMLRAGPEQESLSEAPPAPSGATVQAIPGALNPAIAAVGNFIGRADSRKVFNGEGDRIDNKFNLREAEIDMRVPVDPYADAVLITALEAETPGRYSVDIEEGYVTIKKLPFLAQSPLGLKLRVGRFRPSFGKTNILHTHDLPQSFRPLVVQEFLGEEGFNQNGISGDFFLPTPWDKESSMDVNLQVLTGGDIALSPQLTNRISYLGHLRWFRTFKDAHNLELGWSSYYHPAGGGNAEADLHGVDFMYRWKPIRQGEWKSFILGGEVMFARRPYPEAADWTVPYPSSAGSRKPVGYTVFGQWQFDRRKYAGARWDQTRAVADPTLQRKSLTPYFSYYFSEFLRFRLNYEHRWSDFVAENGRNSVFAEINFVFGAHPPEPFWVNK